MKLNEFKKELELMNQVVFQLENGELVPRHFHITEIGLLEKKYIDCGGTYRTENKVQIQWWSSSDTDHRLSSEKLLKIIKLGEDKFGLKDDEIEVEYQGSSIGKYSVELYNQVFVLKSMKTDCLEKDNCGVPTLKFDLSNSMSSLKSCCGENSSCC